MKASSFKSSYRTLLDNAVKKINEESVYDKVSIHYDEDYIRIRSIYLETSEIITLTRYDDYSNSDDLMAGLITELIYWANTSEYCSALKNHIRRNSKAA
jgi:hypothetical protein